LGATDASFEFGVMRGLGLGLEVDEIADGVGNRGVGEYWDGDWKFGGLDLWLFWWGLRLVEAGGCKYERLLWL